MNSIEEIENLKKLRDEGAISQDEYLALVEKLDPMISDKPLIKEIPQRSIEIEHTSSENSQKQENRDSTSTVDHKQQKEKLIPDKTVLAGRKLRQAATNEFRSKLCGGFMVVVFLLNSINILNHFASGYHHDFSDIGLILIVVGVLGLLAFIFWGISVTSLYSAGELLEGKQEMKQEEQYKFNDYFWFEKKYWFKQKQEDK